MQSIKVTELKAHLSRYLRRASRGEKITVRDRDEPIAELGPARRHSGALQFGAGTDIRITRRVSARVMANAFTDYYDGGSLTRFRFTTGAVFGIGNR